MLYTHSGARPTWSYLAGHKQIFSLDGSVIDLGLDTGSYFILVGVTICSVDVAITQTDCTFHCLGNFTWLGLREIGKW